MAEIAESEMECGGKSFDDLLREAVEKIAKMDAVLAAHDDRRKG